CDVTTPRRDSAQGRAISQPAAARFTEGWLCAEKGLHVLDDLGQQVRRVGRRLRLRAQAVHYLHVIVRLVAPVQVQGTRQLLDVDDVRKVRFCEAHDRE